MRKQTTIILLFATIMFVMASNVMQVAKQSDSLNIGENDNNNTDNNGVGDSVVGDSAMPDTVLPDSFFVDTLSNDTLDEHC